MDSLEIKNGRLDFLRVGNLDVRRDFGYAPKYVEAMWLMLQQDQPQDFLICSGRSVLLRDIVTYVFRKLDLDPSRIHIDKNLYRPVDIYDIDGNNLPAKEVLGWKYDMPFEKVLDVLIDEEVRRPTGRRPSVENS
jgi:GDPmannose 4,6-dehydratase